ncbi:hypothetical protein [Enterococcus sp. ZJ1622]|uniref:hypothetical protein n=1 Tax=Enterococcus sp. ZJ1622 TaxID=2709401 RepID=UPI001F14F340|nr:hypothetical protein [Enterococcus sp. ZJ1622]
MNKIIPLLLVLFVGELFMRHVGTIHLNIFLFLVILALCFIFWRLLLSLVVSVVKFIVGLFFINLFK